MAAKKKPDFTAMLRQAADERKVEQAVTEKAIMTGKETPARGRKPRYTEDDPKSTVTFTMTASRKEKLRTYAFNHKVTISDLIGEFVDSLEV